MNSLDIFSVRALMRALEQIHSTTDAAPLHERLFSALLELVPGTFFTLDELDLETGQVSELTSVEGRIPDDIRRRILELIPTHPIMPFYKAGSRGAIRVTDCITQRQFRQTPHYVETLRPIDIRYQMIVTLDVRGKIAGMTVNRDRNFTEKEAVILHLFAPHAALARRNAQQVTALKKVANHLVPDPEELKAIGLTPRQAEIMHWLIQGKQDKEIGRIISMSPKTVQRHLAEIFLKLRAPTRTAASLQALEEVRKKQIGESSP